MKFWLAPLHVPDSDTESKSKGPLLLPLLQLQVFTLNLKSVSKKCSCLRAHEPIPLSQREDSQLASAKLALLICVYSLFTQYERSHYNIRSKFPSEQGVFSFLR